MSPIKGLSETFRLPRLFKIHLGVKEVGASGKEFPKATSFFVFPPETLADVKRVYGTDKPNKLSVIIPVEDETIFASQFYRAYSQSRGCICRGDGENATQVQDITTGQLVTRDTAKTQRAAIVCPGKECPIYQAKKCSEVMCLQFMLPDMPGLGVWQIDTGSINSILNINGDIKIVRDVVGHISMVPLTLSLEPQEIISPEDGKKKKVMCLHLRASGSLGQLLREARAPLARFLILPSPETGHIDAEVISVDEDGVIDEDIPEQTGNMPITKADDKDPLATWSGTSRPARPAEQATETVAMTNRTAQGEQVPPAQPMRTEPAKKVWPHLENMGQLLTRANQECKIKIADVYAILGVRGVKEITGTPDQAWAVIEAKMKEAKP